ncbi:hypothetical protein V6N13_014163 [Hibiscus sabdariffa]|uniref:F-box domain-containing protein n=1 Tax=Hibiscus sabdariffa TaxID=183260 RepID=A0ABR2RUN4_9ROSI
MKGWSRSRSELPEDLIMEILLQLPVKSLIRFNCVCKSWCCCFQTSNFIYKHHHINLENNRLNLLCTRAVGRPGPGKVILNYTQLSTEQDDFLSPKLDNQFTFFKDDGYPPDVLGPRNGLLFFYSYGQGKKSAIWNPSTREFKTLPPSSIQAPSPGYNSIDSAGFGFDSNTGDYKVIQFVDRVSLNFPSPDDEYTPPGYDFTVELYSLKTDSWKEIPFSGVFTDSYHNLCDTYVNGTCHWHAGKDPPPEHNPRILSFDMADEKFSTFPFPEFGGDLDYYWFQLLEFHGSLGIFIYPFQAPEKSFDLWVMNGEYTWTKQLCIDPIPRVENPLGFWKNGDLFLETPDHQLVLFEHRTGEVKRPGIKTSLCSMRVFAYAESLVRINGTSEHKGYVIRQPCIR